MAPATQAVLTLTTPEPTAESGQPIHFTLQWDRPIYRYAYTYDWGDKSEPERRTDLAADHTYDSAGSYTVRVAAQSLATTMLAKTSVIESNAVNILVHSPKQVASSEPLSAILTVDTPNPHVGDKVTFEAALQPQAPDAQFTYDFGDGSAPHPDSNHTIHVYRAAGSYSATVTILTHDGEQSTTSPAADVRVAQVSRPAPLLKLTLENREPILAGNTVTITAALDPPEKITGFEFDWGDGSPPEKAVKGTASHPYSKPGSYEVVVTAETRQTYDPQLQGVVQFTIQEVPASVPWGWIVGGAAAIICIGLVLWRIFKGKRDLVPKPVSNRNTNQSRRDVAQQALSFLPRAGVSLHVFRMKPKPRSIGSLTLNPETGSEEHTVRFKTKDSKYRREVEE